MSIHNHSDDIFQNFSNLPTDLKKYIAKFIIDIPYKLLDWIDEKKIDMKHSFQKNIKDISILNRNNIEYNWYYLSENPNILSFIHSNLNKLQISYYCLNPKASSHILRLFINNHDRNLFYNICQNPNFRDVIIDFHNRVNNTVFQNPALIDYIILYMKHNRINKEQLFYLSKNSEALHLFDKNPNLVDWQCTAIYENSNPELITFLKKHKNKLNWDAMSSKSNLIELLLENIDNIYWSEFSSNEHPKAIQLLLKNKDKIDIENFCKNPSATSYLHLFEKQIDYYYLSQNPNIFVPDLKLYEKKIDFYIKAIKSI